MSDFAGAMIVIVTVTLMFGINLGDSSFITAPKIFMAGLCLFGFTVLRSKGVFVLLGKIILGIAALLWLGYVIEQAQAGIVKHFDWEEFGFTTLVMRLLIFAVSFFYGVFVPGPLPAPLAYLETLSFIAATLLAFLYSLILAGALQLLEILLNRIFWQG